MIHQQDVMNKLRNQRNRQNVLESKLMAGKQFIQSQHQLRLKMMIIVKSMMVVAIKN
jgi:hypothetical protein